MLTMLTVITFCIPLGWFFQFLSWRATGGQGQRDTFRNAYQSPPIVIQQYPYWMDQGDRPTEGMFRNDHCDDHHDHHH